MGGCHKAPLLEVYCSPFKTARPEKPCAWPARNPPFFIGLPRSKRERRGASGADKLTARQRISYAPRFTPESARGGNS